MYRMDAIISCAIDQCSNTLYVVNRVVRVKHSTLK